MPTGRYSGPPLSSSAYYQPRGSIITPSCPHPPPPPPSYASNPGRTEQSIEPTGCFEERMPIKESGIDTASQDCQSARLESRSQRELPSYPVAIPAEKISRALELYKQYKATELPLHSRYNLSLEVSTRRNTPKDFGSISSSRADKPNSPDANWSSVVFFGADDECRDRTFIGSTGKTLRTRRHLTPTAKAKAALVRYLGACQKCLSRRVL